MKVTQLLTATALLAPVLASPSFAGEWYATVSVGQTSAEVEGINLNDGMAYGAGLGTTLGPVRVEGGVARLSGDFAGIFEADALYYSVTGYLDLPIGDNASAFGGLGLGYLDGEASAFGSSTDASGDGWHWAVGGAYEITEQLTLQGELRHITADGVDGGGFDADVEADEITVGLRLRL